MSSSLPIRAPKTCCPLCSTEQPARRAGAFTVIACSSCGDFAYDRPSAAALRADPTLRAPALSHIETSPRMWPNRIARFIWQEDAGKNGPVGFAWMERLTPRI